MYELNGLNPDVIRAELDYRRERISAERRFTATGHGRWLRLRRRPAQSHNS